MSTLATQAHLDDLQVAYSYCLSQLSQLGERSAFKLKKRFPTHESWVRLTPSEREEAAKATLGHDSPNFINTNFDALVERALVDLKNHEREGIRVLSIDDSEYPALLKLIQDPPLVLFVKGSIDALSSHSNVAVVGTRNATPAGEKVAFKIAKWLAENRWCVVSGLAKGIDAAAHKGTLDAQSPTVAVMATPLNKIYPTENRQLAANILDLGGCWISEFPLWKKPYRGAFVQRDRIQSGVSVAVIPVQTDIEGGTMHTVRYAEQQRRLVLCPRPIQGEQFLAQYAGVRSLIENRRAIPFSGEEYGQVLEFLNNRRAELLKTSPDEPATQPSEVPVGVTSDAPSEHKATEPRPSNLTPKVRRKLQVGFEFAEELPKRKRQKPRQKELELQIKLLQQLCEEIIDAKRPDGAKVSDPEDIKEWLEGRIRILRAKADGA
jgi:DNA processing protein